MADARPAFRVSYQTNRYTPRESAGVICDRCLAHLLERAWGVRSERVEGDGACAICQVSLGAAA